LEQEHLEIQLGLRPESIPESTTKLQNKAPVIDESGDVQVIAASADAVNPAQNDLPTPHIPLRERLWQMLLSERTLQAMLFLGIFLLFSAAISFVFWGWKDFSAPLRVAIPTGFTGFFFALGWYVRTRTPMHRSGIALSAIAALLIPIDFYTIYINFHVPMEFQPAFWLITSVICLGAYTAATVIIRSRFFGYLVGTAAGSAVLALLEVGHQMFGISLDWRSAGLSLLALILIVLATAFDRLHQSEILPDSPSARLFAEPFRYMALLGISTIMLFTFGWRYAQRDNYDTLHYSLIITWWLGAFVFGWGAVFYRSRGLGLLAAITLPVAAYLTQAPVFNQASINPAWHAFGWAMLVPLYFIVGYNLQNHRDDPLIFEHGRTATGWGVALLMISAVWPLADVGNGAAVAASHSILALSVVMATILWRKPGLLYGASLLFFTAVTFGMTEPEITTAQLSIGWISLAIVHILVAINVGTRFPIPVPNLAGPLVTGGFFMAAFAVFPPLFPYEGNLLGYALGNWILLSAWGAWLAHRKYPGFVGRSIWRQSMFHWFTVLSLPAWIWIMLSNMDAPSEIVPVTLAILAGISVGMSYALMGVSRDYARPWYVVGLVISMGAPIVSLAMGAGQIALAITLLIAGLLYIIDSGVGHRSLELSPGGFIFAWGYLVLLNWLGVSWDAATFALAFLIAIYMLTGQATEGRNSVRFTHRFLAPLYLTSHLLTLIILWRIYIRPFDQVIFGGIWTDEMRLWGAASQLLIGLVYTIYAWGTFKERWGHFAAWVIALGGGFFAMAFSSGSGSSAAKVAAGAIIFILAERVLNHLRARGTLQNRKQAIIRLTWRLYHRPLLVTGWGLTTVAIGLALVRNTLLLGGGHTQMVWTAVALLLVTGLFGFSVYLFRQARFVWLAAPFIFAPWTILTYLGWFTPYRPELVEYALSWMVLAWSLLSISVVLGRRQLHAYELPLKLVAHLLVPLALVWGSFDNSTSRFTIGLAVGFYGLASWLDHRTLISRKGWAIGFWKTKFFYPFFGLFPIWSMYLLAWIQPSASLEQFGLILLIFCPLGLIAGKMVEQFADRSENATRYSLPAFLTGFVSLVLGTLFVAGEPGLLALVLIYDALLVLISAWLFSGPAWVYPAAILFPISLLLALNETGHAVNRYGWWLIGLASIYFIITWSLRRAKLATYCNATLIVGFALILISLPPSSQDQTGALWGYSSAAALFAVAAFWLRRPILLWPATALSLVPYAIVLQKSSLEPEFYGLALFPGAIVTVVGAVLLDHYLGAYRNFPWSKKKWRPAMVDRLTHWWGLPLYSIGFGLVCVSPLFTQSNPGLVALNYFLMVPVFSWAIYRFRLRVWMIITVVAGHLSAFYYLGHHGWWQHPDPAQGWVRFLPITVFLMLCAMLIGLYRNELPSQRSKSDSKSWSYPLFIILLFDILIGQTLSLGGSWAAVSVTLVHIILLVILTSLWRSPSFAYGSLSLGLVALLEISAVQNWSPVRMPIAIALLMLLYGLAGYSVALVRMSLNQDQELRFWIGIWELPLQRMGVGISLGNLVLAGFLGMDIVVWTISAILGLPFQNLVDYGVVQMAIGVLGFSGLFFVVSAMLHRWRQLGYIAVGMLLASWMLHVFYIRQLDSLRYIQWYIIPVGVYLLSISFLEYHENNKSFARWIDYLAMALMIGSLFWQTILFGWIYALLLGGEGLAAMLWGSARRLRRFLYVGMIGVVSATVGQLINSLWSINQWVVFGIIGLMLVFLAVMVERKLEEFRSWQRVLDTWE